MLQILPPKKSVLFANVTSLLVMKKLLLYAFVLGSFSVYAQKSVSSSVSFGTIPPVVKDTVLIGYISQNSMVSDFEVSELQEFEEVMLFVYSLGVEIIHYCKNDGLILMELREPWKSSGQVVEEIQKNYQGACYIKHDWQTFYSCSCKDSMIKEKHRNQ